MKKLGLVLGGGGLKGLAHIGVLQVLEDNNIPVAVISGTSSGSIVAALHVSGLSAYQMEEEVSRLKPADYLDYNISGLLLYIAGFFISGIDASVDGVIKGKRLERLIFRLTQGKRLRDGKIPAALIACDIDSGREVIFSNAAMEVTHGKTLLIQEALLSQAVRASTAIPAAFVPLELRGLRLVDGGVQSMVPVIAAKMLGAEYILAVNLGKELYIQGVNGIPDIVERAIDILGYETSETEQKLFADLVLYPDIADLKLSDLDKAPEIIRCGRRAMKKRLAQLKEGLASC